MAEDGERRKAKPLTFAGKNQNSLAIGDHTTKLRSIQVFHLIAVFSNFVFRFDQV